MFEFKESKDTNKIQVWWIVFSLRWYLITYRSSWNCMNSEIKQSQTIFQRKIKLQSNANEYETKGGISICIE